jgi:ABC-type phosphate transport system ATPase subunit
VVNNNAYVLPELWQFSTDESRIGQMVEFGLTAQIFTAATHPCTRDYVKVFPLQRSQLPEQ